MGVQREPPETATWRTAGFTTLVLERNEVGRWRASQDGVDVAGYGETAQRAAADYCRSLAEAAND